MKIQKLATNKFSINRNKNSNFNIEKLTDWLKEISESDEGVYQVEIQEFFKEIVGDVKNIPLYPAYKSKKMCEVITENVGIENLQFKSIGNIKHELVGALQIKVE